MRIVSSQQPLVGSPKSKSLFSRLLTNNSELKTKQVGCIKYFAFLFVLIAACSCNRNQSKTKEPTVFKGLYSFGPEIKSFKDCDSGREFWVTDSSAQLELQYSQLNFEKPYEPVYVELGVGSGKIQ
jgi:hypothetical protein